MAALFQSPVAAGKRTRRADPAFARHNYIAHPDRIRCTVARGGGRLLGLQSLRLAAPGNEFDVTPGRGIMGTHIHPEAAGRGIGRALFAGTRAAAVAAQIPWIDATIAADNADGPACYEAMGFRDHAAASGRIRKSFRPA